MARQINEPVDQVSVEEVEIVIGEDPIEEVPVVKEYRPKSASTVLFGALILWYSSFFLNQSSNVNSLGIFLSYMSYGL